MPKHDRTRHKHNKPKGKYGKSKGAIYCWDGERVSKQFLSAYIRFQQNSYDPLAETSHDQDFNYHGSVNHRKNKYARNQS